MPDVSPAAGTPAETGAAAAPAVAAPGTASPANAPGTAAPPAAGAPAMPSVPALVVPAETEVDGGAVAEGGCRGCRVHGEDLSNQLLPKKIEAWASRPPTPVSSDGREEDEWLQNGGRWFVCASGDTNVRGSR